MFYEAPKALGIIDFNSLISACQIAMHKSNPWACNFANIRSCGQQSNAFNML